MKKTILVAAILALTTLIVGCSDERTTKAVVTATDGLNGKDGISPQACVISQLENGAILTCGDSQAFISNGLNGESGSNCSVREVEGGAIISCEDSCAFIEDGKDGNNASMLITDYNTSSCVKIVGTNTYTKPTGSNNYGLYSSSNCSSNTKVAEVSQGEAYWVASKVLATHTSNGLRVITFN